MKKFFDYLENSTTGRPLVGAVVEIHEQSALGEPITGLATVYSDSNGTPVDTFGQVTTDDRGNYEFYVADGYYTFKFYYGGSLVGSVSDVEVANTGTGSDLAAAVASAEESAADAAASELNAAISAGNALASELQAATYLGAFNTSTIYADESTGRAAVADGGEFRVQGTEGIDFYRRVNSGSSTFLFTMPSLVAVGKLVFVRCTTVTSGFSNNDFAIQPVDTNTTYVGDGTRYIWVFETPLTNSVGSGGVSIQVRRGNGTTFTTLGLRYGAANASPAPNDIQSGDLMLVRRMIAGEDVSQRLRWLRPSDLAARALAETSGNITDLGKRGSTIRPLYYLKQGTNRHIVDMRFHEDKYDVGQSRRQSDMIRTVLFDMADFMSDTGNSLAVNSYLTRCRGKGLHDLNMQFTNLIGGIVVDTGRSPTTIEPPVHGGKFGDAVGLYVVSGNGHGYVVTPSTTITGTYADASTSGVDTDVTIDPEATINYEFYGDKITVVITMKCENAAHDIYCVQTHTLTLDPIATDQIRIQSEFDFTSATGLLTVTPGFLRGFGLIAAFTDIDRCQAIVNSVAQPIQTIDLRPGTESDITLGYPEQVYFWHSDFDAKQIVVTNNAGYGYTHWLDSGAGPVLVANGATQTYLANFSDYVKLYGALYGDHSGSPTPVNMTGKKITTDFGFRFILADARTYP